MSAHALRELHVPGQPLLLANAWDAGTAKLVEAAGFPAVATSSVAVAETLGYADGEAAPVEEMFAAAQRIAGAVSVPVTVDAEAGYGLPAEEFVERLLATGADGCNIEDTDHRSGLLRTRSEQTDLLQGIVDAAADRLVINARIDSFLRIHDDDEAAVADAIERARMYVAVGVDCVYPIFVRSPEAISAIINYGGTVNTNVLPGGLSVRELAQLNVSRISLGGGLWRRTQGWLTEQLADFHSQL